MKIAIPVWNDCVSTVLDYSTILEVIDVEKGTPLRRHRVPFVETTVMSKIARLKDLNVDTILCGAVSRPFYHMTVAAGIRVVPFLRGSVDEILQAYLADRLTDAQLILPGCGWGRRQGGRGGMGRWGGAGRGKMRRGWL